MNTGIVHHDHGVAVIRTVFFILHLLCKVVKGRNHGMAIHRACNRVMKKLTAPIHKAQHVDALTFD